MNYTRFYEFVKEAVKKFNAVDSSETIRLIAHLDADGITASSIIIRAFMLNSRKYILSIVPQLTSELIEEISKEPYNVFVFVDIGSGSADLISEKLSSKQVLILDHHKPKDHNGENIVHVNPCLFGIDGGREISGAGVVFLFAKEFDKRCESMAHVAVIGAIGDVQENSGFLKLNTDILNLAVEKKLIELKKDLKFFGAYSKPIPKVLLYAEPKVPGINSEDDAIRLLNSIGIEAKNIYSWPTLSDLSEEQKKKLASAIVIRRIGNGNPEDIFGTSYLIANEKGPFRDAREFATILNACGRLDYPHFGIGACLGDETSKRKALEKLVQYKREISGALGWFEKNKKSENVFSGKNFMIINAEKNIRATIAGTLCSILAKSGSYSRGMLIMGMARDTKFTKVSLRIVGETTLDLRNIIKEIIEKVGGETGGHMQAAGGVIKHEDEQKMIEAAKEVLEKYGN